MKKLCAHCKRGNEETASEAIAKYKGYEYGATTGPFFGYLCKDHVWMIEEDGGHLTMVEPVTKEAWGEMADMLFEKYEEVKTQSMPNSIQRERAYMAWRNADDKAGRNN